MAIKSSNGPIIGFGVFIHHPNIEIVNNFLHFCDGCLVKPICVEKKFIMQANFDMAHWGIYIERPCQDIIDLVEGPVSLVRYESTIKLDRDKRPLRKYRLL